MARQVVAWKPLIGTFNVPYLSSGQERHRRRRRRRRRIQITGKRRGNKQVKTAFPLRCVLIRRLLWDAVAEEK